MPATDDFNRGDNEGVGYFEVNQKRGWRWNAAKAFLRPACTQRANFTVWTGAQVTRLADRTRCRRRTALQRRRGGEGRQPHRGRGARRSHSQRRRDRLAADPAAVGHRRGRRSCSLRHRSPCTTCPASAPTCRTTCRSARCSRSTGAKTLNTMPAACGARPASAWNTCCQRSGPMSMAPSQLGAFTRSSPGTALRQPRVPRAAAQPGRLRRAAAQLPRVHRQRVQPQPDEPRHGAHPQRKLRGRAADRAELPEHARRPQGGRRLAARDAPASCAQPALAKYQPAGMEARRAVPERRGTRAAGR